MTEHKYTDEEVIKALECCGSSYKGDTHARCSGCPLNEVGLEPAACFDTLLHDLSLDLINRQKAEVAFWMDAAANAKKEAVKEFAERMKERMNDLARIDNGGTYLFFVGEEFIDALVKEFTEEKT